MAAKQFYIPYPTAFNSNGLAVPGAQFFFYLAGTTTKTTIYTDSGLTVPASNPVVANGAGRIPTIYLNESVALRLKILDASGAELDDIDNFIPGTFYGPPIPLTITTANGVSVSTRTALAAVSSPVDSQTARLSETDKEGDFTFHSGDHSADVTAETSLSLSQGAVVAPASDTSGASGVWARPKSELYDALATVWGCTFDGSTDDTIAFQGTMLYCANNGYTMRCPAGTAIINGPLQDTGVSDAQLLWPRITDINSPVGLRIKGASPVPLTCEPTSGNYTVIKSNLTGTGSLFGGKSASGFQNRTCISLYMEDIICRLPQNSAAIGIDLRYVHMNRLENVRVDVPDVFNCVQPTHTTNVGIYSPLDNVSAWSMWNNVVAAGYYRGVRIGELVTVGHMNAAMCLWPISTQIGSHASIIKSALVTNSPNTILTDGALQLYGVLINIEHDKTAAHSGSGPDWVELGADQTATRTGYDIFDSDGSLSGDITFQMHDSSIPLHIHTGATNVRWRDLKSAGVQSYGRLFPSMSALTNAASVCTVRGMNGGWPWQSFIQASTTLTDQVGVISFAGPTGTDTRVAQINVGYDGALDAGKYTLTVFKSGAANTALTIPSTGHVIPGVLPNAANDTAAAALTPPVPVGGLYRNGNAVQVRLT